jgi:hypothetical protein
MRAGRVDASGTLSAQHRDAVATGLSMQETAHAPHPTFDETRHIIRTPRLVRCHESLKPR